MRANRSTQATLLKWTPSGGRPPANATAGPEILIILEFGIAAADGHTVSNAPDLF